MKIFLLHQHFYPEPAGAAIRLTDLATELARKGFEISVLTGAPSYTPNQRAPRNETYQGVSIHRLPSTQFSKNSRRGRVWNTLSFLLIAFFRLLGTDQGALLLIGSDPPLLPFLGYLAHRIRGQRYIVLIYDIYPELAIQLGYFKKDGWFLRLWRYLDSISLACAEKIIVIGDHMKNVLIERLVRFSRQPEIVVIPNCENGDLIRPLPKRDNWFCQRYGLEDKTVVLHSGNMGRHHELVSLIEAAESLRGYQSITFLMIGGGYQEKYLRELVRKKKLENVRFLPYQSMETTPYSLACGDIAVVSMRPGTEGLCVPSKLQTALASGSAIVGIVPPKTEVAELIEKSHCGIRVDPEKPAEVAQAILMLHNDRELLSGCRRNARRLFETYFTKDRGISEYLRVLQFTNDGVGTEPTIHNR